MQIHVEEKKPTSAFKSAIHPVQHSPHRLRRDELAAINLPTREEFSEVSRVLGISAPEKFISDHAPIERKMANWVFAAFQRFGNVATLGSLWLAFYGIKTVLHGGEIGYGPTMTLGFEQMAGGAAMFLLSFVISGVARAGRDRVITESEVPPRLSGRRRF